MNSKIEYLNPEGLLKSPAFSQVVTTQGTGKTIYVGGQDAVNAQGELVGKGDLSAQTKQVMLNLQTALSACGATLNNLVKLTIYVLPEQDLHGGFQAAQEFLGKLAHPPVISVLIVAGLAHPDFLVEIEATAFLPEE